MSLIKAEKIDRRTEFTFIEPFPIDLDPISDPPLTPVITEINDSYIGLFFFEREGSTYFHHDITTANSYGWGIEAKDNKKGPEERPILYELEIDNLRVRNKMSVLELLYQQKRAVNGSLIVSSTGKVKNITRKTTD